LKNLTPLNQFAQLNVIFLPKKDKISSSISIFMIKDRDKLNFFNLVNEFKKKKHKN